MVAYLLDFHENIRFSMTLSKYQEQPYSLLYFLIYLKNALTFLDIYRTIREYSYIQYFQNIIWEYSPEFHRELFPNILRIYHGNVPRILHEQYSRNIIWEYSPEFHCKIFPNILGICHGNVPRIFHEHILGRWALIWGSISKTANIFWNILGSAY